MTVFLRILLSLALVLDGTSGAWAMPSASGSPPAMPAAHAMAIEAAEPPCHVEAESASVAPDPAPLPDDC